MSKDEKQAEPCLQIALDRIAAEKTARTGRLDLGNLGLARLPMSLSELDWLEELRLGGVDKVGDTVFRQSEQGSREETDEAYNPNRIVDIAPSLTSLPRLHILDCSGADLQDLSPLAALTALQSLNCRRTQVTDLSPLAALTALRSLDCGRTRVDDLSPLAALTALQSLNCWATRVDDLSPLVALTALQSLRCGDTRVTDLSPLAALTALQSLDCKNTSVTDHSPLSKLTSLRYLRLWDTPVGELPEAVIELPDLGVSAGVKVHQNQRFESAPWKTPSPSLETARVV